MTTFKKNMFWAWKEDNKTVAIIGLVTWKDMDRFRDKLSDNLCKDKNLFIHRVKGNAYSDIDFDIELYSVENEDIVWQFIAKDKPNILSAIFRTKYYKEWKEENTSINKLLKVELLSSLDLASNFIKITSNIYSPEELMSEINKTAVDLKMELYENSKLNYGIVYDWGGPDMDIEPPSK